MDFLPLPLFPEGNLRESVVTTVWVGVFVISFFNLRFGWTYSGLVVPGYLVPLILTNPVCAGITVLEGVLAYALVRVFSEHFSRFGWWCSFFGRDRFFALFLSAVLVRVGMDGMALPALAGWLQGHWNLTLDYRGMFHSFGLIIIALIANQFWKTGFWRGVPPLLTTVAITFFIVRFGLMTVTNFNIGHLSYLYSNAAASLLASPKSYIILIVTGFVASRMNLRYGWEYNGILIPALLALQWYDPLKIVSSLIEAGVVYIVSDLLLHSPLFRGVTMEGARKLLLFFNVAYAYRYCLGFVLPLISPGIEVNDYYGFAYLLSSLIALKMHSKHIVLRLTRATLQTSLFAAVAANLVGLWLASLLGSMLVSAREPDAPMAPLQQSTERLEQLAAGEKLRLYRKREPDSVSLPTPNQLNYFREALGKIRKHAETGAPEHLAAARRQLEQLGYGIDLVAPRRLVLREQEPNRGWGFFCVDLDRPTGLLLEVPAPLEEWGALDAAVRLFNQLDASALAVAGGARGANKDGTSDVLANPHTPFGVFHAVFARRNVLQVRGYDDRHPIQPPVSAAENTLYVKSELPRSLSLLGLREETANLRVFWKPAPAANAQQKATRSGFAELWLARPTIVRLRAALAEAVAEPGAKADGGDCRILEWLLDQKESVARGGSDRYIPPLPEEMAYLDEEVLTPLLEAARTGYQKSGLSPLGRDALRAADFAAARLGFEATLKRDSALGQDFLAVSESGRPRRFWGTLVIRLGETQPFAVQVPRPLFDLNSLECGVHLFDRLRAESLLLAGSHNEANLDQSSDVLDFRNAANFFSLASQVTMRQAKDRALLVFQCRGYAPPPGTADPPDALVAFQNGIHQESALTPLGRILFSTLGKDGWRLEFVNGSPATAGYEISGVPQAYYVNASWNKEFAVLWLSPLLRDAFRPQDPNDPFRLQFEALQIPIARDDLRRHLREQEGQAPTRLPTELKTLLSQYAVTLDIVTLRRALVDWPGYSISGLLDRNTRQLFLLVSEGGSRVPVVLNLRSRPEPSGAGAGAQARAETESASRATRINLFLASRSRWLEWSL